MAAIQDRRRRIARPAQISVALQAAGVRTTNAAGLALESAPANGAYGSLGTGAIGTGHGRSFALAVERYYGWAFLNRP
jgi:hypothetical protein